MELRDDTLYCPPLPLLWGYRGGARTPGQQIHEIYAAMMWRTRGPLGKALLALRFLTWPVIVPPVACYCTLHNGKAIKRRTGLGVLAQFFDQIAVAARHGILPPWYYMFELYRPENRSAAGEYLHRFETKANLYRIIKARVERESGAKLNNKLKFSRVCAKAGLPTPEILLYVKKGRFENLHGYLLAREDTVLPQADLFLKPVRGKGGRGTHVVRYRGGERYEVRGGDVLGTAGLIDFLVELSREQGILVQRRLFNHPDMLDLCADALCCVRIMTCRNESGGFEVTNAVLRMAQKMESTVDGLHRGGIAARVDVDSGALGLGTDLGFKPGVGWVERSPRNGVQIAGRMLPNWEATRDLVVRAHEAFPYKVTVGWDVAITPDGPVVVEGNGAPCVDILQRVDCEPLGRKRFGALLAFHCVNALDERERRDFGIKEDALEAGKA
ncbi:MAG: sugar-transfer associated ATP-grasp domain-containing protein [Rhodovibrionaceae bacterium]